MENPALTERRRIDALGTTGLADPSQIPAPMLGFAQARLGGDSNQGLEAVYGLGGGGEMLDIDFGQAGPVPDFSWLSAPAPVDQAKAPAKQSGGPGEAAPADASGGADANTGSWTQEDEKFLDQAVANTAGGSSSGGASNGGSMNGSNDRSMITDYDSGTAPAANASAESSSSDQAAEESASANNGGNKSKYDQLFSQFGQTKEGNCASVAVIKGALDKYDGKVFQSVSKTGQGYDVVQQDGKKLTISKDELKTAAKFANFKGQPNEAKSLAILCFATIAKRGSQEGMGSFEQSLKKLDSGFDPKKAAQLLGLGNKIKEIDPKTAAQQDGAVAWNNVHAVYEDNGKTDSYGTAKASNGTDTRGNKLTNAFIFT
ncbi:MAG: hypothetical protein J0I12_35270 [Candidatus Eremiobacteraeota bacterium]|nr:hypothetical protein [Candidatus Eremiobacteraeota bacterium]